MRHILTVLGVLASGGFGLAAAQDDPPAAERPVRGQANTRAAERADGPSDAAMIRAKAAAHGLCMAIEGNALAHAARMAGATDVRTEPDADRQPAGGARPGQARPGDARPGQDRPEGDTTATREAPVRGEAATTATTAARGAAEGITQEGEAATPAAGASTRRPAAEARGAANAANPGNPGEMLQRHSAEAFEASRTLFAASERRTEAGNARPDAANAEQAIDEFCRAAREYGRALEAMSQAGGAPGRDADGNLATGRMLNAEDSGQVCLINHSVKETVEGVFLKKLMQMHAQNDGASRALLAHAQEMYAAGQRGIRMISGGDVAPELPDRRTPPGDPATAPGADPAAPAAAPGATTFNTTAPTPGRAAVVAQGGENDVVTLARLGREVVNAAVALDQSDRPAGDRPGGNRPAGDLPAGDRPAADRPAAERLEPVPPAGDRPEPVRPSR